MSTIMGTSYAIACDYPGCNFTTEDIGDYAFWGDIGNAVDEWVSADGYSGPEGDFCMTHTTYDDDEIRPLLPSLAADFALAEGRILHRIDVLGTWALQRHHVRCSEAERRWERKYAPKGAPKQVRAWEVSEWPIAG